MKPYKKLDLLSKKARRASLSIRFNHSRLIRRASVTPSTRKYAPMLLRETIQPATEKINMKPKIQFMSDAEVLTISQINHSKTQ